MIEIDYATQSVGQFPNERMNVFPMSHKSLGREPVALIRMLALGRAHV
jgi:hypothetical protein